MGNALEVNEHVWPLTLPHLRGEPNAELETKYDALFGFPRGRKKREYPISYAEMESAGVPTRYRDYCAHFYLKHEACMRDHFPLWYRCDQYKHEWDECEYQDLVLRMKEWERERRLDRRNRRIMQRLQEEEKLAGAVPT